MRVRIAVEIDCNAIKVNAGGIGAICLIVQPPITSEVKTGVSPL